MAPKSKKEIATAVATLLDGLNKAQSLPQKHNFKPSQASFKRALAAMALGETANFYKRVGAPDHVYDALQAVALALMELNDGVASPVLKGALTSSVTVPAEIEMLRAEVVALLYAVTDGAPPELQPRPTKQKTARDIEKGLGKEWSKIARAKSGTGKPGPQFLTNLLLEFRKAKGDNSFGALRFADQCTEISIALLTSDSRERDRRIKAIIADIKARLATRENW